MGGLRGRGIGSGLRDGAAGESDPAGLAESDALAGGEGVQIAGDGAAGDAGAASLGGFAGRTDG
jgi:hypothetical protein